MRALSMTPYSLGHTLGVPVLLVARQTPRLAASFLFLESASRTLTLSSPSHPSIFLYSP
jgi:hypothetical protein